MVNVHADSDAAWNRVSLSLHWLLAALILAQFVLGYAAKTAPLSPAKLDLFVWHKSIGVTILILVLLRAAWRLSHPPPALPNSLPRHETIIARAGHYLLYALMFSVPLSGWWISDASRVPFKAFWSIPMPDLIATDRSVQETAEAVHYALTISLLVVVSLHVAAALRHHFVLRNEVLRRMLPWGRR